MDKNNDATVSRWVDDRLASLGSSNEWQPDQAAGLARLREQRGSARARGTRYAWLAAAATTTCVTLVAFPVTRAFAQRCVNACVGETTRVGQLFGLRVPASADGSRKIAPDFSLNDSAGRPVKLSDFRGRVVLLNFWATWCGPCKIEIPWFVEFQQKYPGQDFVVLGVSMDDDGWKSVKPYIADKNLNYRVMIGNDEISRLYGGLDSLPTTLIIDKSGRIVSTHVGLISKREYEAEIEAAIR